jgi:hypothetical protein
VKATSASILFGLTVFLAVGCHHYWGNADRFQAKLRCGMTAQQIRELAREYGSEEFRESGQLWSDAPTHYVRENSTSFMFWLQNDKLHWFSQGRYFGITGLRVSLRTNVCTHERTGYPMIHVNAPAGLRGGSIYLDGAEFGELSAGKRRVASASIGVPILKFGSHELRLVKRGFEPIVRRFTYAPEKFWPEVKDLVFDIKPTELRGAG